MSRLRKVFWMMLLGFVFAGLGWLSLDTPNAHSRALSIPEGFNLRQEAAGVQLYQKEYANGTPDYVQVVRLAQGAQVRLLHGAVTEERPGKGAFGGNDARFRSRTLSNFWEIASQQEPNLFCVTNGLFFYMPESPTRLSLPLKVGGKLITDGYGIHEYPGEKLMLELWEGAADIRELSGEALYASSAPNILGGLTAEANKRAKQYTGRTFAGVADLNSAGKYETVLIFNTRTARQVDADAILKSFGADKVMMLDGGGSTQLNCTGKPVIFSERLIPQALAIFAAPGDFTASSAAFSEPAADTASLAPGVTDPLSQEANAAVPADVPVEALAGAEDPSSLLLHADMIVAASVAVADSIQPAQQELLASEAIPFPAAAAQPQELTPADELFRWQDLGLLAVIILPIGLLVFGIATRIRLYN